MRSKAIESLVNSKGEVLRIFYDEYAESPREWDNVTKMVCFHKRYNLGGKHDYTQDNYNSWEELEKDIVDTENPLIIQPLYLYDHSGISISTGQGYPYNCPWDAGQIGFVYITKEGLDYIGLEVTGIEKLQKIIDDEVQTYDDYIRGDCYWYSVYEPHVYSDDDGDTMVAYEANDSCTGFYGSNHKQSGLYDSAGFTGDELEFEDSDSYIFR
jgi:hypothetical protein